MKTHILAAAVLTLSSHLAWGQVEIPLSDQASTIGDAYRMFKNRNPVSVGSLIGDPGGPQHWDFSKGPQDLIHSFRIIDPGDTAYENDFPNAVYTEETDRESEGNKGWSFHRNVPGQGRVYYGFYDESQTIGSKKVIFNDNTNDIPELLKFGLKWDRVVKFPSNIDAAGLPVSVSISFDSRAHIDAYGTMDLPELGKVSVLRVNELNRWDTIADILGNETLLDAFYVRNYYWYAKGVGIVARITSDGERMPPAQTFPEAAHFYRLFETSKTVPATDEGSENNVVPPVEDDHSSPVSGLSISVNGGFVLLNWTSQPEGGPYRIEFVDSITGPSWQELATINGESYIEQLGDDRHRFFRVLNQGAEVPEG